MRLPLLTYLIGSALVLSLSPSEALYNRQIFPTPRKKTTRKQRRIKRTSSKSCPKPLSFAVESEYSTGIRWDKIWQRGPANLTHAPSGTDITELNTTLRSMVLVEQKLETNFYIGEHFFLNVLGSWATSFNGLNAKISPTPAISNFEDSYRRSSGVYGFDLSSHLGFEFLLGERSQISFRGGYGYFRLNISSEHYTALQAPYGGLAFKTFLSPRILFEVGGDYYFPINDRQRQERLVSSSSDFPVVATDALQYVIANRGKTIGARAKTGLSYIPRKGKWFLSLDYEYKRLRSDQRLLNVDTVNLSGTWNEQTVWNSNRISLSAHIIF